MSKALFFIVSLSFFSFSAQAGYTCTIRTQYSCQNEVNKSPTSCESTYCQKVLNWCYAYTKESGRSFKSAQEISEKYRNSRSSFEAKIDIKAFINEWKMCQSGTWTWSEKKNGAVPKTNPTAPGASGVNTLSKADSEVVGLDDLGINTDGSEEPLCLNTARAIEPETTDISRVRDGVDAETYGATPEGLKKYEESLSAYLDARLKRLGLDTTFVKQCIGDLPRPSDLWRFQFNDQAAPPLSMAEVVKRSHETDFKKLMKNQCLKVVLNPQYQTWASLLKLGSSRFSFLEKNAQGQLTGKIKTCENVHDDRYYKSDSHQDDPMSSLMRLGFYLTGGIPVVALEKSSLNNINTADAVYTGLSFESSIRNTFVPRSAILENVCTSSGKNKSGVSMKIDSSTQNISKILNAYKETCNSFDARYENVKYASALVGDIVIIESAAGIIILSGGSAIPVLLGTAATAGVLTGAKTYNSCVEHSDLGKMGLSVDYAKQKYEECYSHSLSSGAKSTALNVVFGGIGMGVSRIFTGIGGPALERYVIAEADTVVPEILAQSTLGQRVLFRTSEQIAAFGINLMSGLSKCLAINKGDKTKCDTWTIAKEVRNSMIIGFMTEKAKSMQSIPSPEGLKTAVKKVIKDPDYLAYKQKFQNQEKTK